MAKVTFGKTTTEAEPGRDLLGVLLDAGAPISYICMAGSCGTCRVRVLAGMAHLAGATPAETYHAIDVAGGDRLACQAVCLGDGDVTVTQE